jgi:hypothetical protein
MLKGNKLVVLVLFSLTCLFEIISFFLLTHIFSDALKPYTLFPIYLLPLLLIRWIQIRTGTISYVIYMIVPIIQMLILYVVGYDLLWVVTIGIFASWRMYVHVKEPFLDNQGVWLTVVLSSTFLLIIMRRDFLTQYVSYFILLVILFILIRIIINLRKNDWAFVLGSYRQLSIYIIGFFVIGLLLYQSGLFLINTVLPFIGLGFAYILSYPLSWIVEKLRPDDPAYDEIEVSLKNLQEDPFELANQNFADNGDSSFIYYLTTAIVITILIAMYVARKYLKNNLNDQEEGIVIGEEAATRQSFFNPLKELRKTFYSRAGKNEVRAQFYKLQLYLQKRDKGRISSETVEEWFDRIGLHDEDSQKLLFTYRQYRYGTDIISNQELAEYISRMKDIKARYSKKK